MVPSRTLKAREKTTNTDITLSLKRNRVTAMRIGSVEYEKDEVAIIARAFIIGLLIGLPLGAIVNYALGFPTIPGHTSTDFFEWVSVFFSTSMSLFGLWWVITMIFTFVSYSKQELLESFRSVGKVLLAMILFPAILMYMALILGLFIVPVAYFLSSMDPLVLPIVLRPIALFIILPFMIIFFALVFPDFRKRIRRQLKM